MYDAIRSEGYGISVIYFVSLIIFGNFILLNLFLAMLLGNFETSIEVIERKKVLR